MEHWYVYYKVPAADTAAVAQRVRAMFNALGDGAPRACLLQRLDAKDGEVTLMEVYEPVADGHAFASLLDDAVRASGLAGGIVAGRRIERFKDL
ncbi:MAG TPA: DUF4936 family protein [Burkholderiaceae bacterium]|nr:DUF4936 family protein [Burkholderiaceae bacterium]